MSLSIRKLLPISDSERNKCVEFSTHPQMQSLQQCSSPQPNLTNSEPLRQNKFLQNYSTQNATISLKFNPERNTSQHRMILQHTSLRRPSCGSKCEWATASTMTQGDPNRDLTYFASNSTGHVVAASKTHHRSLVSKLIPSDSGSESG